MKLCACGCGQPTNQIKKTNAYYGHVKGEYYNYLPRHGKKGRRTQLPSPNPSGICQCGCHEAAPIAAMTNERIGHVAGEHVRFIRGHVGRLNANLQLSPDDWQEEDRGYRTPCWICTRKPMPNGYCRVSLNGKPTLAHRAAYEQFVGPIPIGLELDHLCRIPACMRPDHLEAVTHAENLRRGRLAKLTPEDIELIRRSFLRNAVLAKMLGVTRGTIGAIRLGRTWV